MSTKDLLREFKALPKDQQKKFLQDARATSRRAARSRLAPHRARWPDVEARAAQITGGQVLPNLILAERDNSAF